MIYELALLAGLVCSFYWLRVLFCALLLALWGGGVILGPIYVISKYAAEGRYIIAVLTIAVCAIPAFPWWMT
jgi:hypothetical protein